MVTVYLKNGTEVLIADGEKVEPGQAKLFGSSISIAVLGKSGAVVGDFLVPEIIGYRIGELPKKPELKPY